MNEGVLVQKNITIPNPWNPKPGDMVLDNSTRHLLNISSNCKHRTTNATICKESLRTANTQAACGSPDDFYYFSPWRAPGSAPVIDACGSAGGRWPGMGLGGAGAQFQNNSFAREGDKGSTLPALASQAEWVAGASYEVGWTVMANHGGGYQYRLAPADAPLTEETFQKMPLAFDGGSALRWGGDTSTQLDYDPAKLGWQTDEGTIPAGSMWRKNPIPSGLWAREGPGFQPLCEESEACIRLYTQGAFNVKHEGVCKCSGFSNGGPLLPNLEIVDRVQIPEDLAPGRYVMQWRWDCEESDQVWNSCSDVTVVAPPPPDSGTCSVNLTHRLSHRSKCTFASEPLSSGGSFGCNTGELSCAQVCEADGHLCSANASSYNQPSCQPVRFVLQNTFSDRTRCIGTATARILILAQVLAQDGLCDRCGGADARRLPEDVRRHRGEPVVRVPLR